MNAIYVNMSGPNQLVHLPIEISGHDRGCALFEITGSVHPYTDTPLYLCADFIQESFIGHKRIPILRRIKLQPNDTGGATLNETFNKMLWLSCNRTPIKELRTYISDAQGHIPPFEECKLSCTLVIIRHRS